MPQFNPGRYGAAIAELTDFDRLNSLGPGTPGQTALAKLEALDLDTAFAGQTIQEPEMAQGCLAGLWLLHDHLDRSHAISQSMPSATGSYWHGIMHRREPDYSNGKYWFRKVGGHPIFDALRDEAAQLASSEDNLDSQGLFPAAVKQWDPFAFIDLCQDCAQGRVRLESLCRHIQRREWELLFDYCHRKAVGG